MSHEDTKTQTIDDGLARVLLALHPDADMDYLERRIHEESMGDYGVEDIRS